MSGENFISDAKSFLKNIDLKVKLDSTEPHVLIEILYEYLSQHISTHFEKTVEGIDTIHDSLLTRQKEHQEILERIDKLEQRLASLESKFTK